MNFQHVFFAGTCFLPIRKSNPERSPVFGRWRWSTHFSPRDRIFQAGQQSSALIDMTVKYRIEADNQGTLVIGSDYVSGKERMSAGQGRRKEVPRRTHAGWTPPYVAKGKKE